jgi:hypothetical protein
MPLVRPTALGSGIGRMSRFTLSLGVPTALPPLLADRLVRQSSPRYDD